MGDGIQFVIVEDDDLLGDLLSQWLTREFAGCHVDRFLNATTFRTSLNAVAKSVDVVIADVRLRDGDGVELVAELRTAAQRTVSAVIISGRPTPDLFNRISDTLNTGWSFLLKQTSGMNNLRQAISVAQSGLVMVDPNLRSSVGTSSLTVLLTEAEQQVLRRVAEGKSNKSIAEEIFTSEKTIERHLSSVYQKLELDGKSKFMNPRVVASLRYLGLI